MSDDKRLEDTANELFDFAGNISIDGMTWSNRCKICSKTFTSFGAASPSGICPKCKTGHEL